MHIAHQLSNARRVIINNPKQARGGRGSFIDFRGCDAQLQDTNIP